MKNKIDFVVTWVDPSDKEWQRKKNESLYNHLSSPQLNSESKYRDWNLFKYWFRSVEHNAPWVNNIYIVTSGHIPDWLDLQNEKIHFVTHADIMPSSSLPTFNSQAIEMCLHRIKGLSENFVYFNDDMFLNDKVNYTDFFYKGLPRDFGLLNVITPHYGGIEHAIVNNIEIINKYFNKRQVLRKNLFKYYNKNYGIENIRNILLFLWKDFTGFYEPHTAVSLNKTFFEEVWTREYNEVNKTVHSKFRSKEDLNFWLIRYWQLCSGYFYPQRKSFSKMFILDNENKFLLQEISKPSCKIICLNDTDKNLDFELSQNKVFEAFDKRYRQKSQFEK
ncbi:Stealth CR1 domain-containing protein [Enterococcus mundtii]|uniref:Capsule biosynthesis protein CapG n=1 Tax=Enterococcus mundtii TaxID=53346 RepID=A0A242L097_ENTMU|nr:Stealth CR1 domain-containing protein [Enterococcus mundtii]OTP27615.1 hypothetical protein A5802_001350 [Enterococcus mundtii]OTP27618.1 hypothetical protein A5802_001353 [Enterococcus mundtii]